MATIESAVFSYSGWPAVLNKAVANRILKQAFLEIGAYWHKHYLPQHFTVAGARKYGYTPRKGEGESGKGFWRSYTGQKKKYRGHVRPLEFSGKGKDEALGAIKIAATSKGCRVKLPRKYNFRHPNSKIDMRKEITAITAEEHDRLAKLFERSVVKQITELSGTRRGKA